LAPSELKSKKVPGPGWEWNVYFKIEAMTRALNEDARRRKLEGS
jgi:hypothetical protein